MRSRNANNTYPNEAAASRNRLRRYFCVQRLTSIMELFHTVTLEPTKSTGQSHRPPIKLELWFKVVSAAAAVKQSPGAYLHKLIERGLPPALRKKDR